MCLKLDLRFISYFKFYQFKPVNKNSSVESDLRLLRVAIDKLLDTMQHSFATKLEDQESLSSDMEKLRELGVALVEPSAVDKGNSSLEKRRSLLSGYLKSSGRSWEDVYCKNCN